MGVIGQALIVAFALVGLLRGTPTFMVGNTGGTLKLTPTAQLDATLARLTK